MWDAMLDRMLRGLVRHGTLDVAWPDGRRTTYGAGGPRVAIRIRDRDTARRLVLAPRLAVGEAYMDEGLTIEDDDLRGFHEVMARNMDGGGPAWLAARQAVGRLRRPFDQWNRRRGARRNVSHHYDLPPALYDLFLDRDKQYSCGYFRDGSDTLDRAQAQKKAHIARKLLLRPGMRVLDVGCGWGGLGLTLAQDWGARVVGVTLSREQLAVARRRAEEAGLADRVEFRLQDYRDVSESFDRVVSVGMFEHVGLPNYEGYFAAVRDRLGPNGVALVHTIGSLAPPASTNPWIARYIFPGGYVPSLSEVAPAVERAGLILSDLEVWRLHYALTLRHWLDRFDARRAEAEAMLDARFARMWRFYLAGSEMAFRHGRQVVFHLQLARTVDAVPVTRDYLYEGPVPAPEPVAPLPGREAARALERA